MNATSWLLLLYSLPTNRNTERVAVWRRLKKIGAVQIKTSTYLLPDQPAQYEQFQWLAKQIRDYGGDSTLVRAQEIEGLTKDNVISLFNAARDKEYSQLRRSLQSFIPRRKKLDTELAAVELERLIRQFRELRQVDFFDSARGHDVAMLLRRAEGPRRSRQSEVLDAKQYRGRTWATRPRPEIDRVGSAWLISKFIDPKAKFAFTMTPSPGGEVIHFDMVDAEFSHHGDRCTFEMLLERFSIDDKALRRIGEMIHDADLEDAKFQRVECVGIDRVLKGWGKTGMSSDEILAQGFKCFDGLLLVLYMANQAYAQPATFAVIGDALPNENRAMGFVVQSAFKRLPILLGVPAAGYVITGRLGIVGGVRAGLIAAVVLTGVALALQVKYYRSP